MFPSFRRTAPAVAAVAAVAAIVLAGATPALARHGADDPAGDDHGVHRVHHRAHHHHHHAGEAHHRHGRGTDDGPNHG